jgi:hypothetical protein
MKTRFLRNSLLFCSLVPVLVAFPFPLQANDATWDANPMDNNWNNPNNWTPAEIPTGMANFGVSDITSLTVTDLVSVKGSPLTPVPADTPLPPRQR